MEPIRCPVNVNAPQPLSFLPFPNELQMVILKQLNEKGIRQASEVCKLWNDNMLNPEALKILDASKLSKLQFFVEWINPFIQDVYKQLFNSLVDKKVIGEDSPFATHEDLPKSIIRILQNFPTNHLTELEKNYNEKEQTPFKKVFGLTSNYLKIKNYINRNYIDASFICTLLNSRDINKIDVNSLSEQKTIEGILNLITTEVLRDERKFGIAIRSITDVHGEANELCFRLSPTLKKDLLPKLAISKELTTFQANKLIVALIVLLNKMKNENNYISLICSAITDTEIISMFANFCRLANKEPDFLSTCPDLKPLYQLIKSIGTKIGNRTKKCAKENLSKDNLKILKEKSVEPNNTKDSENCIIQ